MEIKNIKWIIICVTVVLFIIFFPSGYSWNQKTTISAIVDGEKIFSTSVMKVEWSHSFGYRSFIFRNLASKWVAQVSGDAPYLDLGEGQAIVLLKSGGEKEVLATLLPDSIKESYENPLKGVTKNDINPVSLDIPTIDPPYIIFFSDVDNRESGILVGESLLKKREIKNIKVTIEKTNEPLSGLDIRDLLTWIDDPNFSKEGSSRKLPSAKIPNSESYIRIWIKALK